MFQEWLKDYEKLKEENNMSEEEIIKNIEDMLLHAETNLLDYEALALQGLLDLYIAEKEKNKELNRLKGFEMLDIFNMGKESSRQRIKFDYIPKSKIKEKIEGYDKMIKATYDDITYQGVYRRKICFEIRQILQELLEGE